MAKEWTKEYARFIGRIIFADFLEYPLVKYREFIDKHELARIKRNEWARITVKCLSRAQISDKAKEASSKVIAEVTKNGKRFAIRYVYGGFNKIYRVKNVSSVQIRKKSVPISVIYKLRRISSRNELTHRMIKGIIEHQRKYLNTDDPIDLVPFSQVQLADWLNRRDTSHELRVTSHGICNSWVSRLVNRLSVIIPSGEEKPLKWFFQTQRQINKRLIKKILDKENEDLQSGKLRKPYTDNEIRLLLEALLREQRVTSHELRVTEYSLSRWTVGHCRKDMGIPSAKRRLSGYKYPPLSANFSMLYPLTIESVQSNAPANAGIYEFRLNGKEIEYPKGKTNVIYIGRTMNIKKRMREHLGRKSKNHHIKNFLKKEKCLFRYILLPKSHKEEEKKLYKLFVDTYDSAPKCNRVRP